MEAIYARQSIDKKDSVSIETQIDYCRRYADGEPEMFQDRGFSGKNTNRPAFHRLMQDRSPRSSSTDWTALAALSQTLVGCGRSWSDIA